STCAFTHTESCFVLIFVESTASSSLSLYDALPIFLSAGQTGGPYVAYFIIPLIGNSTVSIKIDPDSQQAQGPEGPLGNRVNFYGDRKSTRLNSSHVSISYAVFYMKKKILKNCTYNT